MGIGLLAVRRLVKRGRAHVFVMAVTLCGAVLVFMALVPVLWIAFIAAVFFGVTFSVAIIVALTLTQEVTQDRIRGRVMGGVQMLFRVGLGLGALGIGALAHSISSVHVIRTLDGNQVGLIVGGGLILLGAVASSGATRPESWVRQAADQ
jgi:MFS family permease